MAEVKPVIKRAVPVTIGTGDIHDKKQAQVKVSVNLEVAAAFKAACAANGVSMASALSGFMSQYAHTMTEKAGCSVNLSTRRQRRACIQTLISQLERVRDNEEHYRNNIPDNLQGGSAFEAAEQCIAYLDEALDLLASAY
jgi:hypothetical protein